MHQKKIFRFFFDLNVLLVSVKIVWSYDCPVEDDPTNLARCVNVDLTGIIYAARSREDLTNICAIADRYMECFKTYTRGCVGYHFGEGSLTEIQNIAMYCCKGVDVILDCPFNKNVVKKCFDDDSYATLADGNLIQLKDIQVGDRVKTLDSNGQLIDTDVVMIMDKSDENSLFMNIETYSNKSLKVSASHLIPVPNGEYKYAKRLFREDTILAYDEQKNKQVEEKIKSILIEPVEGYVAPLTMSGTILVNNILASCYAVVESHTLGHTVMAPVRWWYTLNDQISHLIDMKLQIEQQSNGTHWYPQFLAAFTERYLNNIIKMN